MTDLIQKRDFVERGHIACVTDFCMALTAWEVYLKVKCASRDIKQGSVLFCSMLNVSSIKQENRC